MKIAIDCGHTLNNSDYGAVGIKHESLLTREVGKEVIKLFINEGHSVVNCTIDNASSLDNSLSYRYITANTSNVDYFISIHFNAFNGSAKGTEVLYYNNADTRMENVLNKICELGYTNRGLKQRPGLAVLKNTKMKAMLIECCFCDNVGDMSLFNSSEMAKAIVEGFLNATVNNSSTNNSTLKALTHLRDFQKAYNNTFSKNILVDGISGSQTRNAISNIIVKKGQNSALVGWVQFRVGASVDNVFGSATEQKVREFQENNGLVVDGIVGSSTINKLLEKYNW